MKRSLLALFVLLMAVGLAVPISRCHAGEPKHVLRFNHVLAETDPFHGAYQEWAEAVAKRTNGDVKIEVYHGAQLGVEEDIIEQIRAGAPIGQNTDAARMGNYVKDMAVMNCAYFVETLEEVERLNDLALIKDWKKELEDKHGIHIFSFYYVQGLRHFLTNVPIRKPADLAGLRIRTAPAPAWQESIRAVGAEPVSIPYTEIYPAIQTKAVDGAENVYPATYNSGMFEILNHLSETGHILLINFSITSASWFKSLPPEYQKILDEESQNAGKRISYAIRDKFVPEAKENLKKKGMTIVEAKDIDLNAFREAGKGVYERLGLVDVRKAIYDQMGKK